MEKEVKTGRPAVAPEANPGDGVRSVRTTNVFRAVNFELYAKPNKFVMGIGLIAITGCFGYLAWMRNNHKQRNLYTALDENEQLIVREKTSRWQ